MAFFSGTDTETLKKEGAETNCFVSLIVDTKGTYQAAITRKIQTKSEVTVKSLGTSYEFFGDGPVVNTEANDSLEKTSVIEKEIIEYYMLDVTREEVTNPLAYLDDRFVEINNKKEEERQRFTKGWLDSYKDINAQDGQSYTPYSGYGNWYDKGIVADKSSQLNLWEDSKWAWNKDTAKQPVKEDKIELPFADLDKTLMDKCIATLVTGSLLHLSGNTGKFDWKKFIKKDMDNYYEKLFPETSTYAMNPFELWSDFIIEFIIRHCEITTGNDKIAGDVAFHILNELETYRSNLYIDEYCKILENYLES